MSVSSKTAEVAAAQEQLTSDQAEVTQATALQSILSALKGTATTESAKERQDGRSFRQVLLRKGQRLLHLQRKRGVLAYDLSINFS